MITIKNLVQQQILEKAGNKSLNEICEIAVNISKENICKIFTISFNDETKELEKSKKNITDEDELDSFHHKLDKAIRNHSLTITSLTVTSNLIMMNIKFLSIEEYFHLQIDKNSNNFIYFYEYVEERIKADDIFKNFVNI